MKSPSHRIARYVTLAAVAAAAASWSSASYACPAEPYVSGVCAMAWTRAGLQGYLPANGQTLSINQYSMLYSLLGTTYGGTGTSFNLPDLRGRTVIGAGTAADGSIYTVGQKLGSASTTLSIANLPPHSHAQAAVDLANVTGGTIDLSKATATVSMAPVTYTANTKALTLKANSDAGTSPSPIAGGVLATASSPAPKLYSSAAPNVDMQAGAFGGSISVTSSGTPTVTLGGSTPVALTGSIAGGVTGTTGTGTAFSNMQPSLALSYYIAAIGIYPQSD